MDTTTASIYIENLLDRLEVLEDGRKKLSGPISHKEFEALKVAVQELRQSSAGGTVNEEGDADDNIQLVSIGTSAVAKTQISKISVIENEVISVPPVPETADGNSSISDSVVLDTSSLTMPKSEDNARICIDFGTAMSKATLVHEDDEGQSENVVVLQLGSQGNQNTDYENMLVSSVYIANDGYMHFGDSAVEVSKYDAGDDRQRLDNIKRRISEDGIEEKLDKRFNPTEQVVNHRDIVIAYLMFLTWTINKCTDAEGFPRNIERRFAMPCLSSVKRIEVQSLLKTMLGEAQILADTFTDELEVGEGISLTEYCSALVQLRTEKNQYDFISQSLTEPLGVAGSLTNWKADLNQLIMIVDVGAGTSDYSLYRIRVDQKNGIKSAFEVDGSSQGITEAGNYLDLILNELIIRKSGIADDDPSMRSERWKLERDIRENKEALFIDGSVSVALNNGHDVEIMLDELLELSAVKEFTRILRDTMVNILESVSSDFIEWVDSDPRRNLIVVLTGGGATLPMVQSLVVDDLEVNGKKLRTKKALEFPTWLKEERPELEEDYARIAVSLGGARKNILGEGRSISSHASDGTDTRKLERY